MADRFLVRRGFASLVAAVSRLVHEARIDAALECWSSCRNRMVRSHYRPTRRCTQQPPALLIADGSGNSDVGFAADTPSPVAVGELIRWTSNHRDR